LYAIALESLYKREWLHFFWRWKLTALTTEHPGVTGSEEIRKAKRVSTNEE
jgi:hypothetical protein